MFLALLDLDPAWIEGWLHHSRLFLSSDSVPEISLRASVSTPALRLVQQLNIAADALDGATRRDRIAHLQSSLSQVAAKIRCIVLLEVVVFGQNLSNASS